MDQSSKEAIELGTKEYPFKTLDSPVKEINMLGNSSQIKEVYFLFKENTLTRIK